jgi:uncharacterized protein
MAKMIKILCCLFLVSCGHLFYHPDQRIYSDPDQVGYRKIELMIPSENRLLHAWQIDSQQKKDQSLKDVLIVQFHGNAQNISSHFAALAWITHHGATLLTFDWSGYGKSQGEATQANLHHDALAILQFAFALKQRSGFKKLVLMGQSLGGAVLSRAVIDVDQSLISLLVLDSTFASYQKIAKSKLQQSWVTYIFSPLAYLLVSDKYAAEDHLAKISVPSLVVHAEEDSIVPFPLGQNLFNNLQSKKTFWKLNSRSHTSVFFEFGNHYRDLFRQMIIDLN